MRQSAKLETASTSNAAAVRPFRKKSSGDASPTAAMSDHGAAAISDGSARPALRAAIQSTARAPISRIAIAIVINTATRTVPARRRQSKSGPVSNSRVTATSASSAASSRSRMR